MTEGPWPSQALSYSGPVQPNYLQPRARPSPEYFVLTPSAEGAYCATNKVPCSIQPFLLSKVEESVQATLYTTMYINLHIVKSTTLDQLLEMRLL